MANIFEQMQRALSGGSPGPVEPGFQQSPETMRALEVLRSLRDPGGIAQGGPIDAMSLDDRGVPMAAQGAVPSSGSASTPLPESILQILQMMISGGMRRKQVGDSDRTRPMYDRGTLTRAVTKATGGEGPDKPGPNEMTMYKITGKKAKGGKGKAKLKPGEESPVTEVDPAMPDEEMLGSVNDAMSGRPPNFDPTKLNAEELADAFANGWISEEVYNDLIQDAPEAGM